MAEHMRHWLARSGVPVRPGDVRTLAALLDEQSVQAAAPAAVVDGIIEQALDTLRPVRFAAVSEFAGFRRALADVFEEAPAAVLPAELAALQNDVQARLQLRGLGLRHIRLRSAAESLRSGSGLVPSNVVLDGFFTLSPAELDFILTLAERTNASITLPDWPGSQAVRKVLLAAGFEEQRLASPFRTARRTGFSAATVEHEVEEIARRILDWAARGRAFREMAIVLRSREPYAGLVETTLARFGIPARLYFDPPVGSHPALVFFANIMNTMLAGWDRELLLRGMRMPVSGWGATPAGDELDFSWREMIPAAGLPLPAGLEHLARLDGWRRERLEPKEWAARLKTLRSMLPQPEIGEHPDRDDVVRWQSTSAALALFEKILDDSGIALQGFGRCPLSAFWKQVETGLALEPLRVPDARRNLVHVMDAYEARQWELPLVFVCGLIERHFPQYHREDAILGDAARRRAGLSTVADRQLEERFLFELATSRATEETILSYPRFNEQGEDTLPSFFLDGELPASSGARIVPRMRPGVDARRGSGDPPHIAPRTLSATGIESFLQCPFQFFARKTLGLRRRPAAPRDRLDLLLQGTILHRALAEWTRAPLFGSAILDQAFDEECAERRVSDGYRTEAVRLELLRHFRRFIEDHRVPAGGSTRVEESFRYALTPLLNITGRIDRLETGPAGTAIIIDYKYSAGNKIRERIDDSSEGHAVQGGLYLAAAKRAFGLEPVAMLFCGLKKDVTWDGWHVSVSGLESLGAACTAQELHRLAESAESAAVRVHEAIGSGDIAVRPTDPRKCRWCDYADICRVESAALIQVGHG